MRKNKPPKVTPTHTEYLQLLKRKLNELMEAAKEGFFIKESITFNFPSEPTKNTTIRDNVLDSILMKLRPFLLQKEIFYFPSVCKYLLTNKVLSSEDEVSLREWRKAWVKVESESLMFIKLNGVEEDWFDLWLYGEKYHTEFGKTKKIAQARYMEMETLTKIIFTSKLQKYVALLLGVKKQILDKYDHH